jgi:hypothetical protein
MAWVKEASGATGASSATVTITVPAGGFPSGHLLVLGVCCVVSGASAPNLSVSDTRSNTWASDRSILPITGATTYVQQFSTVVSTTLNAGDTITITASGNTPSRYAASVQEFDDTISGKDTGSTFDNGGSSSASISSGNFTTTNANTLIVGTLGLVSQARTLTPGGVYTAGTKVASTGGSSDRAVQLEWKTVSSAGTYVANGTLNSGSIYGMLAQAYIISGGGGGGGGGPRPGSGNPKVWNGSAWVAHPAKVWNGSAWVAHKAKGWDGTDWVESK